MENIFCIYIQTKFSRNEVFLLERPRDRLCLGTANCKLGVWVQPIANRVAQHVETISKNFQFSTSRTRILMGFIIYYLVLIVNPMGLILVRWKKIINNLEMLCHPICNWLYVWECTCVRVKKTLPWCLSSRRPRDLLCVCMCTCVCACKKNILGLSKEKETFQKNFSFVPSFVFKNNSPSYLPTILHHWLRVVGSLKW